MSQEIFLTVIEVMIGIVVEGVILSMIFAYIANLSSEKQNHHLKQEMNNIEAQNKFIYQQITNTLEKTKSEIISQIKESHYEKGDKTK